MKQLVCEACGSKELIKQDGVFVCQSCDTKYSVEEATKMTTGIDTSASLEKALKNARRAMERKDYEQAEKFYGIVLMEEPENWEATFYSTYAKAMGKSISEAANLVTNSIKTVLKDLKKLDDAVQQEKAITQISVDLVELCEAGYNSAIGDYNSTSVYSANDIYMAKVSCANDVIRFTRMLVFFGKELISEFGENEYTIKKIMLFYEIERKTLDESLFGSIFNAQFDNEGFISYLQESNCEHRKWLDKLNELTKAESSETIEAGESSEATENEKKPEPSRSDTILGCLIIIVMIVAVICIGRCACSGPSETPSETNEKIEENKEQKAKADSLRYKADSLQNEESYALGKKLFAEKKYDEALPILGKINDKHKNYGEVKDMITFADEYIKAGALSLLLGNYVYAKDGLNVSGTASKEFQSILNAASDKLLVLQNVVINFGKITILIDSCKQIQKYELKYLKPQERNNVKATSNKLITQAKNKLKNEQLRDFPILRKEFANMFSKMNSELQVVARAKGNRNTTLEFVGTFFVNEANIDTHHKMLISSGMIDKAITFFRFKRILYKWYENDNGFYYTYNTYADDFEVNKNTMGEIKK